MLSAGSSGLDECLQSFSHSEDLQFLLQNYKQCRTLYTNSKFIEKYSFFLPIILAPHGQIRFIDVTTASEDNNLIYVQELPLTMFLTFLVHFKWI